MQLAKNKVQKLVIKKFSTKINKVGMTVDIKSTETRRDETRTMEYYNCYPTSIEIQGFDMIMH